MVDRQLLLPTPPSLVYWDVMEEHLDEAEFLFEQRRTALASPLFTLDHLSLRLEGRLAAHLDGLAIGGPAVAERLLYPLLEETSSSERTTAATLVLLGSGDRNDWREVLEAVSSADNPKLRGAISKAIELYDAPHFETVLEDAFEYARSPRERAALLDAMADRHLDPGESLAECLDAKFQGLVIAAVRTAGNAGRQDLRDRVEQHLGSTDSELLVTTIEAGLSLGSHEAWAACRELAVRAVDEAERALLLLALLGGDESRKIIEGRLDDKTTRRAALFALGFTGSPAVIDRCLPFLESDDDRTAKLAAEAICAITGLDLLSDPMFIANPQDDEDDEDMIPLDEDDLDADLVPQPIDRHPQPEPSAVVAWWKANGSVFSPGVRYLYGKPFSSSSLSDGLLHAPLRRRHALALELSLRSRGTKFVSTDTFASQQLRQLAALSDLSGGDLGNRFGGS